MENKNFLERLQSANDDVKRRWMFAGTAIIMVIVILVWLSYFNSLITGFSEPQSTDTEQDAGFTFWHTMRNGTAILYDGFADKLRSFGQTLNTPREYIIQPPN